MRWAAEVPYYMYIDNVRILDANGNEIALAASSTPADNNAASADVPVSDSTTSSASTGNIPAASAAMIMICAFAVATAAKSRRK